MNNKYLFSCSVYAISDGTGNMKVGVAKDVHSRMKSIQTGNPHSLQWLFEISCSSPYAREASAGAYMIEHATHKVLAAKRMAGEWFAVDYWDCFDALHEGMDFAEQHPWFEKYQIAATDVIIRVRENDHIWYWPTSDVHDRGLVQ